MSKLSIQGWAHPSDGGSNPIPHTNVYTRGAHVMAPRVYSFMDSFIGSLTQNQTKRRNIQKLSKVCLHGILGALHVGIKPTLL